MSILPRDRNLAAVLHQVDLDHLAPGFVLPDKRPTERALDVLGRVLKQLIQAAGQRRVQFGEVRELERSRRGGEQFVGYGGQRDVEIGAVEQGQPCRHADEPKVVLHADRGRVEPDVLRLFVGEEHAELRVEQLATEEEEPFFAQAAGVDAFFVFPLDPERLGEAAVIPSDLLDERVSSVPDSQGHAASTHLLQAVGHQMIPANVQHEQRRLGFFRREVRAVGFVRALDHLALAIVGEQEDLGAEGEQEGILTQREGPVARVSKRESLFLTEADAGVRERTLASLPTSQSR